MLRHQPLLIQRQFTVRRPGLIKVGILVELDTPDLDSEVFAAVEEDVVLLAHFEDVPVLSIRLDEECGLQEGLGHLVERVHGFEEADWALEVGLGLFGVEAQAGFVVLSSTLVAG